LPGKPLLNETGKFLIQHVYEQALRCKYADQIAVATDDDRIREAVLGFGGKAYMTSPDHESGTDRITEVARQIDAEIIVNLQGDEPLFDPKALDDLVEILRDNTAVGMATLATPLRSEAEYRNPNTVKVVRDDTGRALYFSRSPIPHVRDGLCDFLSEPSAVLHHLGVYAYRRATLFKLAELPPHRLELLEKLEQLRALAHGIAIQVGVIPTATKGVDTLADYANFVAEYRRVHTS
jgi:3-deoxy-manno-octulosonate cytidylyltransferase (CMP-KDO synthetase)